MTTVTSISQFNYLTKLSAEAAKKNRKGCDVIRLKSSFVLFNLDQSITMLLTSLLAFLRLLTLLLFQRFLPLFVRLIFELLSARMLTHTESLLCLAVKFSLDVNTGITKPGTSKGCHSKRWFCWYSSHSWSEGRLPSLLKPDRYMFLFPS